VVTNVGRVLVTVLLLALHYGLEAAIWGNVIYTAAVAVYGWLDMYRLSGGKARLDRSLILEQLHYCWPLWITVIIGTVGIQFDKLLISRFFDPGTFAVYSYGAMELPVVGMITASLATAMMPNLVILADQGKTHEALDLWQEAGRKCSLLIFPCFVFFLAISRDLMVALFGEGFAMAAWPFSLYLLLLPFRIVIFGGLFRALGKTRPYAISALLGLITDIVVGTALTVAGHGGFLSFIGPAIGMLSTSVLACAYSLNALSKIMHLPISKLMRWKELGRTMLLCLPCGVLILVLPLPFGPQGWLHFPNISAGLYLPCKLIVQAAVFAGAIIAVFFGTRSLKPDEKDLFFMPWRVIRRLGSRTESQEGTVSAGPDGNAPAQAKDANGVNRDA
jgi:O-antigen/teichoic acid export membrane protein